MTALADALESRRVILCVGSGGVGKTTTAAALAVEAARRGRRTAVLTVDPSHRLKDALGLSSLAGRPSRVSLARIGARGAHLDALLLDVKRTFDELVHALAATPEQARAVLENRLYQNLSGTLAGTAEYMAVEQVYRLAAEGGYDLLVVDTPPARHAVDFLDAPRRLANLLDSRAFAILKDPTSILPGAGSRLAHLILAAVLRGLERFTGIGLVREVGEFVGVIEALTGALRERVRAVGALLTSDGTMPLLVTAPEPRLVAETEALVRGLGAIGLSIHGIVVNRALARGTFGRRAPDPGLPDGVSGMLGAPSCARSARGRRRRSPRWSTRRARRCSPRCRSSPPIRARSRAWRRSPATSSRTRAARPPSVCEPRYSPARSRAAPDPLRLVRRRAGRGVRRRSILRFRLTRLPWMASSLLTRRFRSAREGRFRRPSTVCMFRSTRPLASNARCSACEKVSATRGFESRSSASRPSPSSPRAYRRFRMCVSLVSTRLRHYREAPHARSIG